MASTYRRANASAMPFAAWALNPQNLSTRIWNIHWEPQRDFLFDGQGCPIYDFVGVVDRDLLREQLTRLRQSASTRSQLEREITTEYETETTAASREADAAIATYLSYVRRQRFAP